MSKRRCNDFEIDPASKRVRTLQSTEFDWSCFCFMCGEGENPKKCINLTNVTAGKSVDIKSKVLKAANIRNDLAIQNLLDNEELNLHSKSARYHRLCYQNYLSERVLKGISNTEPTTTEKYNDIAKNVLLAYQDKFESGELVFLPQLCESFIEAVVASGMKEGVEARNIKSSFIKSKFMQVTELELTFHSYPGRADIVALSRFPLVLMIHKLHDSLIRKTENPYQASDNRNNENTVVHQVAALIKSEINKIPKSKEYFLPSEVSIKFSKQFVPQELQKLICWIIDDSSFLKGQLSNDEKIVRRTLSIAETVIYCSRRSPNNSLTPPFIFGLTLQLHHSYAKKSLIDTLHSHGFCMTNDDLRRFLTSTADNELEKNKGIYIPSGIIHRDDGGGFIHEGDDNIDINTETIDGKNTYHAMARVIFQNQRAGEFVRNERIPKQSLKRALPESSTDSLDVSFYQKPSVRPNPPEFTGALSVINDLIKERKDFHLPDLTWALLRNVPREIFFSTDSVSEDVIEQSVPSWVPFNSRFDDEKTDFTVPQYLPALNAKPSDLSTVYTTLKKGQQLFKACGQKYSIHTFDQQLFALSQLVKFDRKEEFSDVILRLGTFHTTNVFNSCIGKIWGDSGLRDMLVESGVYAGNSVDQMLEGKQFYRAIRAYTLCYEVLLYLMYQNFFEWLVEENIELFNELRGLYENAYNNYEEGVFTEETLHTLTEETNKMLLDKFNEFRSMRCSQIPTFRHWDEGLQCFQILLQLCRSEREGEWKLEKSSVASMLPYFFVCNKVNYSRWGTYHLLDMSLALPKEVEKEFESGNFSVRLTPGPFRGMYSDMAVESTVIKGTKSATGIVGLTMKESTVLRWAVTRNVLGLYSSGMQCRSKISTSDNNDENFEHEGERPTEILKYEKHFGMILQYMKNHMTDPFSAATRSDALINISSGLVASPETQQFLLNVKSIGIKKLTEFVSKRLEKSTDNSQKKSVGFFDPITKTSMKTFSESKKKTVIKVNGQIIKRIISAESVYQRALAVSAKRKDVDLQMILSFPLTAIPSSLFKPDGCRRTTEKCELMHIIENEIKLNVERTSPLVDQSCNLELIRVIENEIEQDVEAPFSSLTQRSVIVIDGMALLQALSSRSFLNFDVLGKTILESIIKRLHKANEVHVVFDRYDYDSPNPKQEERNRRYGSSTKKYDIAGNRPLADLKAVLANNQNKSSLTTFVCSYIKNSLCTYKSEFRDTNKRVYLSGGLEPRNNSFVIDMNGACNVDPVYQCNHIDADTRLIYHVKCIQNKISEQQIIIVESPDTDVFILLLTNYQHFENKPQIWFYTGKTNIRTDSRRYIPIHCLVAKLNPSLTSSLITVHALTGCDTTSSLFFIGKKTAFATAKQMDEKDLDDLAKLCNTSIENAIEVTSKFLCLLYDPKNKSKATCNDVNSLRYKLALLKNLSVDKLPPSKPAFEKHVLRCFWQINEWNQATLSNILSKDLSKFGWVIDDGNIFPDYYDGVCAIEYLQNFYCSCSQKNPCTTDVCPCKKNNLECCDLCSCRDTCTNKINVINDEHTE